MGFRNPFRIQVDENDVAYVTDYSPDSTPPAELPRAVGHGPGGDRPQARQLRLAALLSHRPAVLPLELQRSRPRTPARRTSATEPGAGPAEHLAVEHGAAALAADHAPRHPLHVPDNSDRSARHAVPGQLQPRSRRALPQLFPELGNGGVGPHGAAKYHYDADNPSETKFPPYYDESVFFGEFTRDYAAGDQASTRTARSSRSTRLLDCGAANVTPAPRRSSATTRWTCSSARTARSTC